MPIDHAERRPDADGAHVAAIRAQRFEVGRMLGQPPHPLGLGCIDVHFAQRQRQCETVSGAAQQRFGARRRLARDIDCRDVADGIVRTGKDIPLRVDVVIECNESRPYRMRCDCVEFARAHAAALDQIRVQGMARNDAASDQFDRQQRAFA